MSKETNTMVLVIDEQEDFTYGALGSKAAIATIPVVQKILRHHMDEGMPNNQIVFTRDTHPMNYLETFEGKHLPVVHCLKNTVGWEIAEQLKPFSENGCIIIDKPTFGSFALIQAIKPGTTKIVIIGLCTDICVISNALLLRAAFPDMEIVIYENACAGTTKEAHDAALTVARSCQIDVKIFANTNEMEDTDND